MLIGACDPMLCPKWGFRLSAEMSEFLNTVCDDVDAAMEGLSDDGYAPACVRATLGLLGIDPDDLDANPLLRVR